MYHLYYGFKRTWNDSVMTCFCCHRFTAARAAPDVFNSEVHILYYSETHLLQTLQSVSQLFNSIIEKQYFDRVCVDNRKAAPRTADPLWGAIIVEENVPWR